MKYRTYLIFDWGLTGSLQTVFGELHGHPQYSVGFLLRLNSDPVLFKSCSVSDLSLLSFRPTLIPFSSLSSFLSFLSVRSTAPSLVSLSSLSLSLSRLCIIRNEQRDISVLSSLYSQKTLQVLNSWQPQRNTWQLAGLCVSKGCRSVPVRMDGLIETVTHTHTHQYGIKEQRDGLRWNTDKTQDTQTQIMSVKPEVKSRVIRSAGWLLGLYVSENWKLRRITKSQSLQKKTLSQSCPRPPFWSVWTHAESTRSEAV